MLSTVSTRAVFVYTATLLLAAAPALAGKIRWVGGEAELTRRDVAQTRAEVARLATRADARHIIMQFDGPLSDAERAQLKEAGITLLSYLGDHAFFASTAAGKVDPQAVANMAAGPRVAEIRQSWKLHPDLDNNIVHDFAVVNRHKDTEADGEGAEETIVAAYILFHQDVRLVPDAVNIALKHGAFVRSELHSINGLVIELPVSSIRKLVDEDTVMWMEPPLPKLSGVNNSNREITGANIVQEAPYDLDGSGVTVLVYDGGYALESHGDFGGRLTVRDSSGLSDHATHVSGTVGGDGSGSGGLYRGMAPGVTIESYGFEQVGGLQQGFLYTDPGDIEADYDEALNVYNVDLSNNSIGSNTAPNGFPCEWEGNYGATGALIDAIARGSLGRPFRIVWANGNERQTSVCFGVEGYPGEYHTTAPPACAKNHITVGALNSNDDSVTGFTSWGPTDDGRIKPDISAPGCQSNDDNDVTSCSSSGGYTGKCGTSMAAPTVTGLSALILQDYRANYPTEDDPRGSTLKTVLAHTAVDLENPGPDYMVGYGSVRVEAAINQFRDGNFLEDTVSNGEAYSFLVLVSPADTELKVTLAWDDAPGTPNVSPVLVNDLDLRVFDASNTQHFPWTLAPFNPSAPAVRTVPDHVNNIEQVVIDAPAPGVYRVEVHGFNVPQGPQSFSVAASPVLVACSPSGIVALDRNKYACSATATVRVVDCDLNTDDGASETLSVTIVSDAEPAGESILLTETAPETAAFEATIPLETVDAVGTLLVADGDTVSVSYTDADDGQGGLNVVVTSIAVVDCSPPVISNVMAVDIEPRDARITFDTDEDANAAVSFGLSCAALRESASAGGFGTAHSVSLVGLEDDTSYFYTVSSTDGAGNVATDDNGGACYTFTTPQVPDFFTESFGGDNDLDNTTLLFVPNGTIDQYSACAEPIVALPTAPAGGTVLSLGDDESELVTLSGGETVALYGVTYSSFHVGSNGYITFNSGSGDWTETLDEHFDQPRISALYDDISPNQSGTVSWMQLADRVAVTWENVTEYNGGNQNTFQIEMYFGGDIRISYTSIAADDGIVGLSEGEGLSSDFLETDLSGVGSCGPRPPAASNSVVATGEDIAVDIELVAIDDGLPDPPAALTYTVTALPTQELRDAGNGQVIASVPYIMSGSGTTVTYTPSGGFSGADSFQFIASDGGVPPEGGDSNTATVSIDIEPVIELPFLDDFPATTFDDNKWTLVSDASIDTVGIAEPSSPNSARFNGDPNGGDEIQTVMMNLAGHPGVILSYHWQRAGGGEGPDDDEDLIIEYLDNGGAWQIVHQHPGNGPEMNTFQYEEEILPADALHAAFRLRIRNSGSAGNFDDWFIDDVNLFAKATPCTGLADCADVDSDGVRDDGCLWWICDHDSCVSTEVLFADMGGQFGQCAPDGTPDANDRFHALNCFSDIGAGGGYNCEPDPPNALNVDTGGQFGSCNPDGVCDANDAFAALNAFSGVSSCTCPANPAPTVGGAAPRVVDNAALSLVAESARVRAGQNVSVEVLLDRPLKDLRGYQLHVAASGGERGRLELVDIGIAPRAGAGHVFAALSHWNAFNVRTGQMLAGLDRPGVSVSAGYLATFTFQATADAHGRFSIDLLHDDDDVHQRTFLFPTAPTGRIEIGSRPAVIEVVGKPVR